MDMYREPQPVEAYLDRELVCGCGRTHYVPIRGVEIGPGALESLPDYVRRFAYRRPFLLCDPVTWRVAGERCESLLRAAGIDCASHTLAHLGYDEATLGEITLRLPPDADLMIGVGTGSITDMTRYASFKLGRPCFTVATGAPMDGFAASIGILNVNGLKCTLPAHCSEVILGDTDILRTAPYRMTVAGFGDLIGKLNCLNDWELGRLVNDEHVCPHIAALVRGCVEDILQKAPRIRERDPEALGDVMRGLVLSGAAISLYGSSRPASGAEHHMSHYWEVVNEQRGTPGAMHGEQVAVGTVLSLLLAEELRRVGTPDFEAARAFARAYDEAAWEREIRRAYGGAAGEVLALEKTARKNAVPERLQRLDRIKARWEAIRAQLGTLPAAAPLAALLREIGCPCTPEEIGLDAAVLRDTFLYAKDTRARYTLLQLVYDLGLAEELGERVAARLAAGI